MVFEVKMLLHIVLFSFKSPWNWSSLEAIAAERATRKHHHYIREIKGWISGRNVTHRSIAADFAVVGLFENKEDMNAYLVHPDHQAGVDKWKIIADWTVVDLELNSDFTLSTGLFESLSSVCHFPQE